MDAFELAEDFVRFMNREWTAAPEPGTLDGFFADWAQEEDLFASTNGEQATALQVLLVAWTWFTQRPEDFGVCAGSINGLADISLERRKLPDLINPHLWNALSSR